MGDAPDGDENDEDLEGLDLTVCKERIAQLSAEKEREQELTERMQVKLKALNSELAARREEAERIRQQSEELRLEERRGEAERRVQSEANGGELATMGDHTESAEERQNKIRRNMEEQLQKQLMENATTRSARNEHGIRTFDEVSLMVEKPAEEQKKEMSYIDTVLITWTKGSSSEQSYNLTYRVDRNMTSKKLRKDACLYWDISEVEHILKTVTTNSKIQDDVTIQTCFRPSEDAHLYLVKKTPTEDRTLDVERAAVRPVTGVRRGKTKVQTQDKQQVVTPSVDFYKQMDAVPGFKDFMTQRDRNVVHHLPGLRLSSICLFILLAFGTIISVFHMLTQNTTYVCHQGVYRALGHAWSDPFSGANVPAFADINSEVQAWAWLTYTLPAHILLSQSQLRKDNFLPGWLRIRMQQVKEASLEQCVQKSEINDGSVACVLGEYEEAIAGTEDFQGLASTWATRAGVAGRSATVQPWRFIKAEDEAYASQTKSQNGRYQAYDASGYAVDYYMQHPNLTEVYQAFQSDMEVLRSASWISTRTRAVHVSFAAYNGNYDNWISAWFLIEMPASGIPVTSSSIGIFKPVFGDLVTDRLQVFLDVGRFILAFYLCTFHLWRVISFHRKQSQHVRGSGSDDEPNRSLPCGGRRGLTDLTIGGVLIYVWAVRYLIFGKIRLSTTEDAEAMRQSYTSVYASAEAWHGHIIMESFVFGICIYRLLDCLRVNRHIFILWSTVSMALKKCGCFLLIFVPTLVCFALIGHALWGVGSAQYRTFWSSITSTLIMMHGELRIASVDEIVTRPAALLFVVAFYVIMVLLFLSVWVAILVQSYETVRVSSGYDPSDYDWSEAQYAEWWLWGPLARLWVRRPRLFRRRKKKGAEQAE